ncbi:hypothetical protein MRX96_035970 [Rhipicephalus microplus]
MMAKFFVAFFCSLAYVIPNKSIAYEGSGNASCIYNGTEWKHNDYNLSSDPCVFLWCINGNMTIERCTGTPSRKPNRDVWKQHRSFKDRLFVFSVPLKQIILFISE